MKKFILGLGRDILDILVTLCLVASIVLPFYLWWSISAVEAVMSALISFVCVLLSAFVIYVLVDIRDLLINIRDKAQ